LEERLVEATLVAVEVDTREVLEARTVFMMEEWEVGLSVQLL
jgi:hypothetical protein